MCFWLNYTVLKNNNLTRYEPKETDWAKMHINCTWHFTITSLHNYLRCYNFLDMTVVASWPSPSRSHVNLKLNMFKPNYIFA